MSIALLNAEPFEVIYRNGQKETIKIGQLCIEPLLEYLDLLVAKKTAAIAAFYADRPKGWVNSLTDESFTELVGRCHALNFHRLLAMSQKDPVIASALAPLMMVAARMEQEMDALDPQILAGLRRAEAEKAEKAKKAAPPAPGTKSSEPSPAPAPLASAVATGSESSAG